jgi:Zn-finger nucleic acid-binding protein
MRVMTGCPACDEPLLIYELEGVETDHCISCGGTWLDAGELEVVVENAGIDPTPLVEALGHTPRGAKTARRCPRCGKPMRLIRLGRDGAVELDTCPAGHGLWLDRGEMEQVAQMFSGKAGDAVASYFSELYPKQRREGC